MESMSFSSYGLQIFPVDAEQKECSGSIESTKVDIDCQLDINDTKVANDVNDVNDVNETKVANNVNDTEFRFFGGAGIAGSSLGGG